MKTVLITGASGNLGKATVDRFLSGGYQVLAIVSPGKASGFNGRERMEAFEVDLTDEDAVEATIGKIIAHHAVIDAALLLAGGYAHGGVMDTDFARLDRMITVNFNTVFFTAQRLFAHMHSQRNGGKLVFIGARAGIDAKAASASTAYGLSKSLVFYLADILNASAQSHGAHGHGSDVTASVVVPSTIDTPQNRAAMPKADFKHWVKASEIADALFIICDDKTKAWRETVVKVYGQS